MVDITSQLEATSTLTHRVTDPGLHKHIKASLGYIPVPLGIVVKNKLELYQELDDRIFSNTLFEPGFELGIWDFLGRTTPYSVTSGARSMYIVPPIGLTKSHKKLKRHFEVTLPPPKSLFDHWKILKQIASSSSFSEKWHSEVIFLSKKWAESLRSKPVKSTPWLKLHHYILKKGWAQTEFSRKKTIFDVLWQLIAHDLDSQALKTNPYVVDTLKHMVFISTGDIAASAPFSGNEDIGPFKQLQSIYMDCYGLQDYAPTMMCPQHFSTDEKKPVYYSMQTPTLLQSTPKTKHLSSNIDDMRDLKELAHYCCSDALEERLRIQNIPIKTTFNRMKFDFFHIGLHAYGGLILPTTKLPMEDFRFLYSPTGRKNLKFADHGNYIRGCVKLSVDVDKGDML